MILFPHLATTLIYDILRRWILYLNRCVSASESEDLESRGTNSLF